MDLNLLLIFENHFYIFIKANLHYTKPYSYFQIGESPYSRANFNEFGWNDLQYHNVDFKEYFLLQRTFLLPRIFFVPRSIFLT